MFLGENERERGREGGDEVDAHLNVGLQSDINKKYIYHHPTKSTLLRESITKTSSS